MYWGDYQGTHYSPLKQIDTSNVARLRTAWATPVPGPNVSESTPLVVDGVMYGTSGGNPRTVTAIDARTGRQIWRFTRPQKVVNPGETDVVNRGVAILGHRLFVGTNDAALLCLDARTGLLIWEVQVGDTMEGFNVTSPPLIVKDKIIVGHAGGEYAIRGFLDAYDVTGKRLWRFYTIPGPGELGNDTWKGDSWKTGGGATWLTGTYDPELNTVYWPIGNPAPMTDRSVRGDGDNLFTDSVVALDPDTGQRKWHYQFTPNDGHDWDSTEDMVLVDRMWRGQNRKLLMHADRNGHFYVLDRTNGAFLSGTPFIHQTWNKGFDEKGRPMPVPGSNSSPEGSILVYPTGGGATNFQAPSYSPITGFFYLEYSEGGAQYTSAPQAIERGQEWLGRAPGRGGPPAARTERSCAECRDQGHRSGDREDRVGLQAVPGIARQRCAGDGRQRAVRVVTRRQPHRARREDRQAPLALPDRRQSRGVADQLRDRRPAVHRADGRQYAVQLYAAGVTQFQNLWWRPAFTPARTKRAPGTPALAGPSRF